MEIRYADVEEASKHLVAAGYVDAAKRLQGARTEALGGAPPAWRARWRYAPPADDALALDDALRAVRTGRLQRRLAVLGAATGLILFAITIWQIIKPDPPKPIADQAKPALGRLNDANRNLSSALQDLRASGATVHVVRLQADSAVRALATVEPQIRGLEP